MVRLIGGDTRPMVQPGGCCTTLVGSHWERPMQRIGLRARLPQLFDQLTLAGIFWNIIWMGSPCGVSTSATLGNHRISELGCSHTAERRGDQRPPP